jgi:hypothetical protein
MQAFWNIIQKNVERENKSVENLYLKEDIFILNKVFAIKISIKVFKR